MSILVSGGLQHWVLTAVCTVAVAPVAAAQAAPPKPPELQITWALDAGEAGEEPSISATWWGRYQVEQSSNPLTGQVGAQACTGYVVAIANLKDREPFCVRLKYLTGGASGQGRGRSGEKVSVRPRGAGVTPSPVPGTIGLRGNGQITIADVDAGFELSPPENTEVTECFNNTPDLVLSYDDVRHLDRLNKTWSSKSYNPDLEGTCRGTITVTIRGSKGECAPLRTACDHARAWRACVASLLAGLVPIVASALAAAAAEQASDQAAGRPSPPGWFGRFAAAAHQFQAEVQKHYANVPSLLPEADKNCPLLPGPEDSQPCQQAGEQVEDQIKRATERLSHDLAREIDVLETTTSDAAASGARTRLLVALRAALPRLVTC